MTNDPSLTDKDQGKDPQDSNPDNELEGRPAAGPGPRLKEQRENRGLTVGQAAQELRVLASILQALEENRFEVLEAPIFVRGHLRNYARLLELPETEILQEYDATLPEEVSFDPKVNHHRQEPVVGGGTPRWIFPVAWLVILAMLVMGGLWWYAGPHRDPVAGVDSLSTTAEANGEMDRTVAPSPEADESDQGELQGESLERPRLDTRTELAVVGSDAGPDAVTTAASGESPETAEAAETAGLGQEVAQALDERLPEMDEPSPGADEPAVEEVRSVPEGAVERGLVLELEADSWLEVRAADDSQLFYGLAQEGQQLELTGLAPIELFMGNAPAILLQVDGEPVDFSGRIRSDNTARVVVNPPE